MPEDFDDDTSQLLSLRWRTPPLCLLMSNDRANKIDLEMTAADHVAIGSTPPPVLIRNPQKTLAETMDDEELRAFLRQAVEATAEMYSNALGGDVCTVTFFKLVRNRFGRAVEYLRDIGRIPAEFADLDPKQRFALSDDGEARTP